MGALTGDVTGGHSIAVTGKSKGEASVALLGKATGGASIGAFGTGEAVGVRGDGTTWHGVAGFSKSTTGGYGVYGEGLGGGSGVVGKSTGEASVALRGTATGGASIGAFGTGEAVGVRGDGTTWHGVAGFSKSTTGGYGVYGEGLGGGGTGVAGFSATWIGVYGETTGVENGPAGVWGEHKGVGYGVKAVSKDGVGLAAFSTSNESIHAETNSPGTAAIAAYNLNSGGTGAALFAKKEGAIGHAGFFVGNVEVTGNLTVDGDIFVPGADCAEHFEIAGLEEAEPGTVMVIDDHGALTQSRQAYDRSVAGVVSGAGKFKPGIILDKKQHSGNQQPIALVGKVYCKVDADLSPIEVGDMLTTSSTPGHAMKAENLLLSFGAVIGKALDSLPNGKGLLPILVCLQ
jgi:hypothetical protein